MGAIKRRTGGFKHYSLPDGTTYELKDGLDEIYDFIGFAKEGAYFPTDHWELTIIVNFGSMQSGKSNQNRAICELGHEIFADTPAGFECYQTNDLEFTLNYLNREENIIKRKKVIFLIFDDAMGDQAVGMNSLNTIGKDNKTFEELLSMVRHKLANEDQDQKPDPRVKNGFCVLVFSIQSLKRLSTFVRDNCALRIYKTAYDQLEKEFSDEDYAFLREITNDSDKHVYESRSYSLGRSKTDTMKFYFPLSRFKIPVLVNDYREQNEKWNAILKQLEKIYSEDMKSKVLQSYIFKWGKKHGLKLTPTEMREIELELIYRMHFIEQEPPKEKEERIIPIDEFMIELRDIYSNDMKTKILQSYIFKLGKRYGLDLTPNEIREIELELLFRMNFDPSFLKQEEDDNDNLTMGLIYELHTKYDVPLTAFVGNYPKSQRQLYRDFEKYQKSQELLSIES